MDDAVDTNLTLLLYGKTINLSQQTPMKNALRTFGIEHFYKAKVHPRILYIESSSDIEMLRFLARRTQHQLAIKLFSGKINSYYTCNPLPNETFIDRLDRSSGAYNNFKAHFYTLKNFVPELKGCAIFDSDNSKKINETTEDLAVNYWDLYELENYFITPATILNYVKAQFSDELFKYAPLDEFKTIIDDFLLTEVFRGNTTSLDDFNRASTDIQIRLLSSCKMSTFTEQVFGIYAQRHQQPPLLNKGDFYQLIDFFPEAKFDDEVTKKLDLLVRYLTIE